MADFMADYATKIPDACKILLKARAGDDLPIDYKYLAERYGVPTVTLKRYVARVRRVLRNPVRTAIPESAPKSQDERDHVAQQIEEVMRMPFVTINATVLANRFDTLTRRLTIELLKAMGWGIDNIIRQPPKTRSEIIRVTQQLVEQKLGLASRAFPVQGIPTRDEVISAMDVVPAPHVPGDAVLTN